ncbi:hypothetical protein C7448_10472 [Tenacibaculum gallaicum]|uniref:Uncharacterized protein n=1 Tax=Tenacibaculum gallaicum TaxID=561505 RepID=A0A3E0HW18_9FLAO|nr:hypothetical protein [Tenacibaculum gallaicum]REH50460.1 hypothetical protein C7448_10472 [Tenacibaculum gallaicum]
MNKVLLIITFLVTNGIYTINTNSTTVVPQTNSTETTTSDTGGEDEQDPIEDPDKETNG